jgi:hypothetical protein
VVGDPHTGSFTNTRAHLDPRVDRPHHDWQDATFASPTHEFPQAPQVTGFMSGSPGPAPGDGPH